MTHREFTTYRNDEGSEVQVHTVTDDTAGSVLTIDGARDVKAGDTLVRSSNPNVYFVGEQYTDGYKAVDSDAPDSEDAKNDSEHGSFDPSEHNADVVRRYLEDAKARGDRDEFNRVTAAEQGDKNRSTALVDYDA